MAYKLIGISALLLAALCSGVYLAATHTDAEKTAPVATLQESLLKQTVESLPEKKGLAPGVLNATEVFASELAKEIVNKNPGGP